MAKGRNLLTSIIIIISLTANAQKSAYPSVKNGAYRFITKHNKTIGDTTSLIKIYTLNSDYYFAMKDYYHGALVNKHAELITGYEYSLMYPIKGTNLFVVGKDGKDGVIDHTGKVIIDIKYKYISSGLGHGLLKFELKNNYGLMDYSGKILVEPTYSHMGFSSNENRIAVCKRNDCGYLDTLGNVAIPLRFGSSASSFHEGLAFIDLGGWNFGYIDTTGNVIIEGKYSYNSFGDFKNGRALAERDNKYGYINKKGEAIVPFKYYSLKLYSGGYAAFWYSDSIQLYGTKISQVGYIDWEGNEISYPYIDYTKIKFDIPPAPKILPDSSHLLRLVYKGTDTTATLETMVQHALTSFMAEPAFYPNRGGLHQMCIGYGLMVTVGNYREDFRGKTPTSRAIFKKQTLHAIIASEKLRQATWEWLSPLYKQAFGMLNPTIKQTYKELAIYLKNYINNYDKKATAKYLILHEKEFAYYDINGKKDKLRKLSSFVDRLILVHEVIDVKDAKRWINKIADEVATWA